MKQRDLKLIVSLIFLPFTILWFLLKFVLWLSSLGSKENKSKGKVERTTGRKPKRNTRIINTSRTPDSKAVVEFYIHESSIVDPTRNKKIGCWIPLSQTVSEGKVKLSRGGLYVGGQLPREDGWGQENCLVDPTLKVAKPIVSLATQIGYWPKYRELDPAARRVFLDWLEGGRDDPNIDIGFVFIYFYGLERRLIVDDPGEEELEIAGEVERLQAVYGGNRSFHRYSSALLDVVRARQILSDDRSNALEIPSTLAKPYNSLWALTASLAEAVQQKQTVISVGAALNWVLAEADVSIPAVARRNEGQIIEHFRALYEGFAANSKGLNLRPRTPIELTYRSSSGSFERSFEEVTETSSVLNPLKDGRSLRKLANLFDQAIEDMVPYLKSFEKVGEGEATLEVLSKLPLAQRAQVEHPNTVLIASWMEPSLKDVDLPTLDDLVDALGITSKKTPGTVDARKCAETLGRFGYGLMPDPRYSLIRPQSADVFVLFELVEPVEEVSEPSSEFSAAIVRQTLAITMADADGNIDQQEISALISQLDNTPLIGDEKARLSANLDALLVSPPTWSKIRSKVKALPKAFHERLVIEAVAIAAADGVFKRTEMQLLEKLVDTLEVPRQNLYSLVSVSNLTEAKGELSSLTLNKQGQTKSSTPDGYEIPRAQSVSLDLSKLEQIKSETLVSQNILGAVFEEANAEEVHPDDEDKNTLSGRPDGALGDLLEKLIQRDNWLMSEASEVATGLGLSPLIAFEDLNNWAAEKFDEPVLYIEGDELEVEATVLDN